MSLLRKLDDDLKSAMKASTVFKGGRLELVEKKPQNGY
jgi:hypothetical protein